MGEPFLPVPQLPSLLSQPRTLRLEVRFKGARATVPLTVSATLLLFPRGISTAWCLGPGPPCSPRPCLPATLSDMDPSQLTCQGRMTNQRSNPGSASNSRGEKSRVPRGTGRAQDCRTALALPPLAPSLQGGSQDGRMPDMIMTGLCSPRPILQGLPAGPAWWLPG